MRITTTLLGVLLTTSAWAQSNGNTTPELCIDTIDCGGFCGTQQQVNAFLNQCNNGPAGPCFDDCWNACNHSNANNNNPNLSVCTQECATATCPAEAAEQGLLHAGLSDSCPVPDPEAVCFLLYDPVDCGGCVYSNACIATAAGLNVATCTAIGGETILLTE